MNRIIVAIIITFIVTTTVLVTGPKQDNNAQNPTTNYNYEKVTYTQSIKEKVKNTDNIHKKATTVDDSNSMIPRQKIDRKRYMENIRSRAEQDNYDEIEYELKKARYYNKEYTSKQKSIPTKPNVSTKTEENTIINSTQNIQTNEEENWKIWETNINNFIYHATATNKALKDHEGIVYDVSFDVNKNKSITNVNINIRHKPEKKFAKPSYDTIEKAIFKMDETDVLKFPPNTKQTSREFKMSYTIGERIEGAIEEINWNIWHASIANAILQKAMSYGEYRIGNGAYARSLVPVCDVELIIDENKKIIKTKVSNPNEGTIKGDVLYKNIHRAIRAINGSDLLKFPAGTKRKITKFPTTAYILGVPELANPSWYQDIERYPIIHDYK